MEIRFITHQECSAELLDRICALKMQHWDYPVAEQVKWFDDNLISKDIHVCIFNGDDLSAYTTIVNIKYLTEDNTEKDALGIGSVCVDVKYLNQKYGFFVVQIVTAYIRKLGIIGILLCKDELVSFYEKNNWIKFNGQIRILNLNKACKVLTTESISFNNISLNKSF
jgi:hypothetical protein